jgi:hypothetical protein
VLAPIDPDPSGVKHSEQVLASFRNDATTSRYSGVPTGARPRLKAKAERRIINPPINLGRPAPEAVSTESWKCL